MERIKGFTLIELMIGLGLGIFLVGGLYTVLSGNTGAYVTVQNVSVMNEDGRMGALYLKEQLRLAGWRSREDIRETEENVGSEVVLFAANSSIGMPVNNQFISGKDGASVSDNDEVTIRYRGHGVGDALFTCSGDELAQGDTAAVRFYVEDEALWCRDVGAGDGEPELLLSNIERFKIQYYDSKLKKYVSAAEAEADNFAMISQIRFALLVNAAQKAKKAFKSKFSILGLDEEIMDKKYRAVFQETVGLYNNVQ